MENLKSMFRDPEFRKRWLKKVGLIGFLFFLLKGIAWLLLGYFILR
jgi:hypothetical protein